MSNHIFWNGLSIPFRPGETAANALSRAGVHILGTAQTGQERAVFCGIGQCQGCLIRADAQDAIEACLLICRDGMRLSPCSISLADASQGGHDD